MAPSCKLAALLAIPTMMMMLAAPAHAISPTIDASVLDELFPTGAIDDAHCSSEDLELANDSQLNVIFR